MTPAELIADLDQALAETGQDIVLQRMNGVTVAAQVTCRAIVRGYTPEQLVGGVTQQDSRVIISPTQIIAASWQDYTTDDGRDRRIPVKGTKAVINGRTRNVEAAGAIYVDGELVRIEMRVLG